MKIKLLSLVVFMLLSILALFCGYKYFLKKAYPIKYQDFVTQSAKKYGVDESLIFAVIRTESKFCEDARSRAGAIGLMQLTPETFEWLQKKRKNKNYMDEKNLTNPEINIEYGTYFLSILQERYDDEKTILSAYNAGVATVNRWLDDSNYSDDGKKLFNIPYTETKNYATRVVNARNVYNKIYFNK